MLVRFFFFFFFFFFCVCLFSFFFLVCVCVSNLVYSSSRGTNYRIFKDSFEISKYINILPNYFTKILLKGELLVHSEVNANELRFRGLSSKILLYKWFKTFYDKIKPLTESKDSKIYFCNKFKICRLNMNLKVLLYYLRSNSLCYILSFVIKIGCFPLIKAT